MAARQLRLFAPAKPLLDRFGNEFFRSVPATPGVYIMSSETGRVLYVGQSGNLRARLGTYKNAHPDRVSRKILRLVHAVRNIVWEECPSAVRARLRENELLRMHRPKFNTVNTYPQAYRFVGFTRDEVELTFWITSQENPRLRLFGAFKSQSTQAYAALLRLLWAAIHKPNSVMDYPHPLLRRRPPLHYKFALDRCGGRLELDHLMENLEAYFKGISPQLIDSLGQMLPAPEKLSLFDRLFQASDLELCRQFFQFGPKRNHDLRRQYGIQSLQISQDRLDDLLVLSHSQPAAVATPPN